MLITLLTDFGTADGFVAAMKGVILSHDPRIRIVDITHEVSPQDVRGGAYTLLSVYDTFPQDTVHVAVVDPGVGSARRPIVVSTAAHRFVGPDNGLFTHVLDREPSARVVHVLNERYFRRPVSRTFHGRDVFAPVAAALASGIEPTMLGPEIDDPVRLDSIRPHADDDGTLTASVLHIDRFGNCITGIRREDLPPGSLRGRLVLEVGGREIRSLRRFYSEPGGEPGELFAIWGSAGFLEISADRESAARLLGLEPGQPVRVREPRASRTRS
jgi:S-adenosyl-L-methionine hydrolase (adenosine-forming)